MPIMNRLLKLSSVSRAISRTPRRYGSHGQVAPGLYSSPQEYARSFSMNDVAKPTLSYSEGYARYNAIYNKWLAIGAVVFGVTIVAITGLDFFNIRRHREMKNTEKGLEFLNNPHQGYHDE